MAAKDGRGGYRPGSGRKPVPPDDVARIRRMLQSNISKNAIGKTLGYAEGTIRLWAKRFEDGK